MALSNIKNIILLVLTGIMYCTSILKSQIVFPDFMLNNTTISSGTPIYSNYTGIISPGDNSSVIINQNAQVDFKAAQNIQLRPGFSASGFTSTGKFRAYIQQNDFEIVPISSTAIGKYEKFEVGIKLPQNITDQVNNYLAGNSGINPYDPDQISIEATFTSPSGVNKVIYGFYFKDYIENGTGWSPVQTNYPWRVRFAPTETGTWACAVKVISSPFPTLQDNIHFSCVPSGNSGYLQVGPYARRLRFSETHQTFFAIGQDIALPTYGNPSLPSDYIAQKAYMQDLANKGGNYTRVVLAPWSNTVEWEQVGNYDLRQPHLWELDQIFDQAHRNDTYIHLCLELHSNYQIHNPWESLGVPTWSSNPYKIALGLTNPVDFFTSTTAQNWFKKRLRYIVARWGYSTNLSAYELFSEVDQIDGYRVNGVENPTIVSDVFWWHYWMVDYIKNTLGETRHLVTTSYAGSPDPNVYNLSNIDITSMHTYAGQTGTFDEDENYSSRWNYCNNKYGLIKYPKPYILGEMGEGDISHDICSDWGFHNALWSTAFMGGFGAGLYWNYWENTNYRDNFNVLKSFMNGIDLGNSLYRPQESQGVRSPATIESFSLVNSNQSRIYGWMHNRSYYWKSTPGCNGGESPTAVNYSEKLRITGLKIFKKYDIEWYRVPRSGSVSLYSTLTKRTTLAGKLEPGVGEPFLWVGEYAYKIYLQGTRSEGDDYPTDTLNCPSDTLSFDGVFENDTLGTQYSYHWNFGNNTTSTLAHPKVLYQQTGSYTVTLIVNALGFADTLSEIVVVRDCNQGITINNNPGNSNTFSKDLTGIKIYPNPNNGTFQITITRNDKAIGIKEIKVFDIMGKEIWSAGASSSNTVNVDISDYSQGIYYVRTVNELGEVEMKKLIKQ